MRDRQLNTDIPQQLFGGFGNFVVVLGISHERAVKWGGLEGNAEGLSLLRVVVRASAGRAGSLWQGHPVESVAMVQCKDAARDPRLSPT